MITRNTSLRVAFHFLALPSGRYARVHIAKAILTYMKIIRIICVYSKNTTNKPKKKKRAYLISMKTAAPLNPNSW
jgi:hypothetical protein